jgi:hypothetical protein
MKKNSNAYIIVKNLTMSEKRYFKIFSERHTIGSQNKYVALFDQLDKIDFENDIELKSNLKALGVNADFISADKNYLYQLILRSLNEFHNSKTYNLEIKEGLMSIEILFHKGLYHECLKLISKTEELAIECENFQLMIDVLTWKKKCCGYSLGLTKAAEVNLSIDTYLLLLNNLKQITDLYYESNLLQVSNEYFTKQEVIDKYNLILKKPQLQNESNALSFTAKIFFHLTYSNYYNYIKNKQLEFDHLQKLVDILNASKTYAIENPLDYVSIYNRLLSIKKNISDSSFFKDILLLNEFPKKITIRKEVILQRVFVHTHTHELEYYLINNDFENAVRVVNATEKELQHLHLEIEPYHMINLYYMQAITLIYVGQFHNALKLVNTTLNNFDFEARPQVHLRIAILNSIIHFELKNYNLVTPIAKQILKTNTSRKILTDIEIKTLNVLIKIGNIKHITVKQELALIKTLADDIEQAKLEKTELNNGLLQNYDKWITAKLNRKFVSEMYK